MSTPVRQGVVLAAGRGTRLQPLTTTGPKPLQPICNKPIMQYQLEAMAAAGIGEVAIVIGPHGQPIVDYFGDGRMLGLRLTYIVDVVPAGIAASLARAEGWVRGPFAVFLGDIFLAFANFADALTPLATGAAGTIVVRRDTPAAIQRNFAVLTDDGGRVHRVIEKPDRPPTDLKGCGVYVFDQTIFEAIRQTPRSPRRNEYEITDAVQRLIDFGRPVYAADVVEWDLNVTVPADLLLGNIRLLRQQRRVNLVGASARLHDDVQLAWTVVGERAVVAAPARLEECLVLPGAHVAPPARAAHRCIFAEGFVWSADGADPS